VFSYRLARFADPSKTGRKALSWEIMVRALLSALAVLSLLILPSEIMAAEPGAPPAQPDAAAPSPPPVQQAEPRRSATQKVTVSSARQKPVCEFVAHEGQLVPLRECVSSREAAFRRREQQRMISDMQLRGLTGAVH
jgi:hypothetical protein